MIDRYSISASPSMMRDRFGVDVPEFYQVKFNAAPTQLLPVITSNAPTGLSRFYWGTSPEWSKNKTLAEKVINVRVENLTDKPALVRAMKKNRCIVPADGFYAWKKVGKKTSVPYRFILNTNAIFSFAGMWEEYEDTEGHAIQTFMIFTMPADKIVGQIQERMPVILSRESEAVWLDKDATQDQLVAVVNSASEVEFNHYPVSSAILDTRTDLASMILPTAPVDQLGNLTLFD